MLTQLKNSPAALRVVPFMVFVFITAAQGKFGEGSLYWAYALKTVIGAAIVAWVWPRIKEVRWSFNVPSVSVGVLVFAVWVGLDGHYPSLGRLLDRGAAPATADPVWNPFQFFASQAWLAWSMVVIRILCGTLVVPAIEESFYRSFMYRSIARADFESQPLSQFAPMAFFATSILFGLMHPGQWLAGIFCGIAYQGLVLRCGHLGEAMSAHAVTNLLLGIWVVWKGAWQFW